MLTKISWANYLTIISLLMTGYYLFVVFRYYSTDMKDLFSGKRKLKFRGNTSPNSRNKDLLPSVKNHKNESSALETNIVDDLVEVDQLIERLKEVVADASSKKLIPREFMEYLHAVLLEYPNIKNSPYRSSINELIMSECEKYGTVTLSEEEVEQLWKDA